MHMKLALKKNKNKKGTWTMRYIIKNGDDKWFADFYFI